MTISQINIINQAFVDDLKAILGEKLYGAYIFAAAFPDAVPTRDIDFHVILKSSLTLDEKLQLEKLHEVTAQNFPPLGGELDCYYIHWTSTPQRYREPFQPAHYKCSNE